MKYTAFIATLFFVIAANGQQVLRIDTIRPALSIMEPVSGTMLDKGWKWQSGDNPNWSSPQWNDSNWQTIDPVRSVKDSLPQLPSSGIFWLRLTFSIDSAIQQQQLALLVQQSGASEIFYNGELLYRSGAVGDGVSNVIARDPIFEPILLPVNKSTQQVLAVRYALQKGVHYSTAFFATSNPLFIAKLQYAGAAIEQHHKSQMLLYCYYFFVIGLFFLLALIHSGYYFFRKAQKANLYFALYAAFYIAYVVSPLLIGTHLVASKYYAFTVSMFFLIAVGPLLVTAIYALLEEKRDRVYKTILLLSAVSVVVYLWQYGWGWHLGADVMTILVQLAIIRIVIRAARQKKKGARLLVVGAIFFMVSFAFFILNVFFNQQNLFLINICFAIGVLSIPLATSLYLGLESGFLSLSLQEKLDEVKILSEKSIAQEKEKQHLLAAQNETLEIQVKERTAALSQSLDELKAAQSQLVHAEKMASLGELTAGIAHEIQNPLNFVNNFSEVSIELIDEMKEAMDKNDGATAKEIADDIRENLKKIESHGKRADGIVKGMLQHSRTAGSAKESTDINKLVDEYLRLSYHGLRAKDKDFSANYETSLAADLPLIRVVPQDIGRVLLNLFNNAFYSVNQKKKMAGADYHPQVTAATWQEGNLCCIRVRDNGMGVPAAIRDKIFQPFFTTKPTGQGTGLGLSISYDIIKSHGGSFEVLGKEGELAEFIIKLPVE